MDSARFAGKAAIITESEVHHYLAKLATSIVFAHTGLKTRIFSDRDKAMEWLDNETGAPKGAGKK